MENREPLTFNAAGDLAQVVDGLEGVTLVRPGQSATVEIEHALRRLLTVQEAAQSQGQYLRSDARWYLPQVECPVGPAVGDVIVDRQGNRWTVLAVVARSLIERWECVGRDLAIVHGLDDSISVEQAVYTKGPSGEAVATWHTVRTGVRARIQPVTSAVNADAVSRRIARRFQVLVAEELAVDHTHRIRAADGTTYRILGSSAGGIGQLPTIDVEQT
jgi:head-tail adaptor